MIYVGAVLGLGFGECAGLKVGRLDLLRGSVAVEESVGEANGRLVTGAPKSAAGRRTMTMPAPLVEMLAEDLARRGLTAADEGAYVFADTHGGPVRYANFRTRVWLPAARRAGLGGGAGASMTSAGPLRPPWWPQASTYGPLKPASVTPTRA